MSVTQDLFRSGAKLPVTAAANLAAHTFVNIDGTVPASAAECTGGITDSDVVSGEVADLALPIGAFAVRATGTVTKGLQVELLQDTTTVYGNISGVKTLIACAGVQNIASGYAVGRAYTSGVAGDLVLVIPSVNQAKS
jgi:hypothetical protein